MTGTSLNMYIVDQAVAQTWIDDRGNLLLLDGTYRRSRC
jgi:hypothetical protein